MRADNPAARRRWRLWQLSQRVALVVGYHPPEIWFVFLASRLPDWRRA